MGVLVGGMGVFVGGRRRRGIGRGGAWGWCVGGTGVLVGGIGVLVGGTGVVSVWGCLVHGRGRLLRNHTINRRVIVERRSWLR